MRAGYNLVRTFDGCKGTQFTHTHRKDFCSTEHSTFTRQYTLLPHDDVNEVKLLIRVSLKTTEERQIKRKMQLYPDGRMSRQLATLREGDAVEIRGPYRSVDFRNISVSWFVILFDLNYSAVRTVASVRRRHRSRAYGADR